MKIKGLIVMTGVIALMLGSCAKKFYSKMQNLKVMKIHLSYAFGIVNYNALKTDSLMLNPTLVAKAMLDGKDGKPLCLMKKQEVLSWRFINEREKAKASQQAETNKVTYKDYIAQNEAFLAKNKEKTRCYCYSKRICSMK